MTSKAWQGANTYAWRKLARSILAANVEENGGRCRIALRGSWRTRRGQTKACLGLADSVHHTLGRARTGDDPRYLVACCRNCNEKLGDPLAKRKPSARRRDGGEDVSVTRW